MVVISELGVFWGDIIKKSLRTTDLKHIKLKTFCLFYDVFMFELEIENFPNWNNHLEPFQKSEFEGKNKLTEVKLSFISLHHFLNPKTRISHNSPDFYVRILIFRGNLNSLILTLNPLQN